MAAAAFREVYLPFLRLISAPGQPFDPECYYFDHWRKFVSVSDARAGVSHRGLAPNAKAVKALRAERGWTQERLLAEVRERAEIDLSIRTIRRVEAGVRVDVRTLEAIAKTLDEDVTALVL